MEQYKQEFIDFMLESKVLKFGDFTLKSGRKSPFFMNAGGYVTGYQLKKLGEYYAKAIVETYGKEFDVEALKEAAKADYTAKTGKKTVTSVELYIKPEDNRAYYVIDKATGFITL